MLRTNTVATVFQRLRDEAWLATSVTSSRRCVWSRFRDQIDESKVQARARKLFDFRVVTRAFELLYHQPL